MQPMMGPLGPGMLVQVVGYVLIVLGLIGAVLPVLPGPPLIWLGVLAWAWADDFTHLSWITVGVLGVLALLSWGSDLLFSTSLSRRAGVSWRAIAGSIVCGILGGIFLSELPVVGTLFGAMIGAVLGMLVIERFVKGEWPAAFSAVKAYVAASFLSTVFEIVVSLLMIGIFVWRAWF